MVDVTTMITAALGVVAIIGVVYKICVWVYKEHKQDQTIEEMNNEMCLLTYGVLACLKGLQEQGCNGPVTEAINKIEKHINIKALK